MPSKPKTKRQTRQNLVEVKITIGHGIDGQRIQKSFYASGKREAKAKYFQAFLFCLLKNRI